MLLDGAHGRIGIPLADTGHDLFVLVLDGADQVGAFVEEGRLRSMPRDMNS